jgi:hypothetical protein
MIDDGVFSEWINRARRVKVREELERRGLWLRKMNGDSGVPCPACAGRDRFAVNEKRNVWFCRASQKGGDAIALAEYLDGCDFLTAVETVSGEQRPRGRGEAPEERETRETRQRERLAKMRAEQERADAQAVNWRETERARCHALWRRAAPIFGTPVEAYLQRRGCVAAEGARLRFLADAPYWHQGAVIARAPAMIGAMVGPDGKFAGVHQTFLDLAQPKGKAEIFDPQTGEALDAKKTRGSWKGATVPLVRCEAARRLFLGEGIETTLSALTALRAVRSPLLDGAEFHSACNLGNIAGLAADRVPHPTQRITRKDGHDGGARKTPGATPAPIGEDHRIIRLPDGVAELYLLGDGDGDQFATGLAMRRACLRFLRAYPGLVVRMAMAPQGRDFNDVLLEPA